MGVAAVADDVDVEEARGRTARTITYAPNVRNAEAPGPALRRTWSQESALSIRATRSRVEPGLALPPTFRTISFGIDEQSQRKRLGLRERADEFKEKARKHSKLFSCFTDCAAATALAYEKPEADVLLRPPRNAKKDRLVDWKLILQAYGFIGLIETIASCSMAYWYAERHGVPFNALWFGFGSLAPGQTEDSQGHTLNVASSIYFVNLVVMQWFNLFAVRTRRLSALNHRINRYLFPAICFALVFAILFLYIPGLHKSLETAVIPAANWFLPMSFGMGILLLDEGRKFLVRRYPKSLIAKAAW